jgi:hypothetical protein
MISQDQAYYSGVLAQVTSGSDLGLWVGAGFTAVVFPPLRVFEKWYIGR